MGKSRVRSGGRLLERDGVAERLELADESSGLALWVAAAEVVAAEVVVELEQGGFVLDPEEQSATPYYVDVRYENRGAEAIPAGREPSRVSFLPYDPESETDFVYWDAG